MPLTGSTRALLNRFLSNEDGSVSIEAAIMTPLMIGLLAVTFVYNDAFRKKSLNTNAAFTISDAISRETDAIDDTYLNGMHDLFDFLTHSADRSGVRFSLLTWDNTIEDYRIDWSEVRGMFDPLDADNMNLLRNRLPNLVHNERVIVVETRSILQPILPNLGLDNQVIYNLAFSRPRFAPQIVWNGS